MTSIINASTSGGLISTADTSGVLQLQTGGTAAVTIDASQNVGVGTASPTQKLHVVGATTTNPSILLAETSGSSLQLISSATNSFIGTNGATPLRLGTNFTEQMRLDSSGNLGLGVTPSAWSTGKANEVNKAGCALWVGSADNVYVTTNAYYNAGWKYGNTGAAASYYLQDAGTHKWGTNGGGNGTAGNPITFTQAMTLDASGNLLVGTTVVTGSGKTVINASSTNPSLSLRTPQASGTIAVQIFFDGDDTDCGSIDVNTTANTTAYTTSSDYRLKQDVEPMTGALNIVGQLNPVTWNWKHAPEVSGQGFIAHELQAVVPDAVTGEKDGTRIEQYEITPAVPATYDEEGNELTPAVEAVMGEREVPVYQGIDTSFLVATLTAAIQEQQTLINAQQAMLTQLTERISALEGAK